MKILKLEIENFRSIGEKISIGNISNLTTFIGPNNVGKSNILRAINLFFNKEVEPGKRFDAGNDFCRGNQRRFALVNIWFKFDASDDRRLLKQLRSHSAGFKDFVYPVTLRAYSNDNLHYTFTNAKGQKIQNETLLKIILGYVDCFYVPAIKDYKTIINSEMIRKIVGATFQGWGRGIEQSRLLGKNKVAFNQIMQSLQQILSKTGGFVTTIVKSVIPRISKFDFALPHNNLQEFLGKLDLVVTESGIPMPITLENEGSGVQSFSIITMLRLLHELRPRSTYKKTSFLWLIEEPETFMHHDLQRKTFEKLKEFSKDGIIFVTSHSPIFIEKKYFKNVFHAFFNSGTRIESITLKTIREVIGGSLGVSFGDFFLFNRFNLLVEGVSDKKILTELIKLFNTESSEELLPLQDLEFINCRSANSIPHFFNLYSVFAQYGTFLAIFDNDISGVDSRNKLISGNVPAEDLFLLDKNEHGCGAIEDLVEKKIWDKCLQNLKKKGLVSLKVGNRNGKDVIEGYEYKENNREEMKKMFCDELISQAKKDLRPFIKYKKLLLSVRSRFSFHENNLKRS